MSADDKVSLRAWVAVTGGLFGCFMAGMNVHVTSAALPEIEGALGATFEEGSWISTAYLVAEISMIPLTAWLVEVFSLRRVMLLGSLVFLLSSLSCALAPNLSTLILIRVIQGASGAVLIPLSMQLILTELPSSRIPLGMALFSLSNSVAQAAGPSIGGWLADAYSWRWIFLLQLLPGIALLAAVAWSIRLRDGDRERLRQAARQHRIELAETDWRRVRAYAADLAEPGFGLPAETYRELAGSVDQVFHSASAVNFIQPYSYMKRDNVEGLGQVLRFCASGRCKPLMLLSSISVYSWGHLHTGKRLMREDDDIDQNLPAVVTDMGYVRSKWVMEKIADLAAERGLPLMTFRLGYATCHSRTGAHADYQWWSRLARTCLEYRAVPLLRELREGLTTVDYMVEAISVIARQPSALGKKFNLVPSIPRCLTLDEFFGRLGRRAGRPLRQMPFDDWVSLWEDNRDAPLYPLLSMFRDNMYAGRSTVELYQDTYLWDCTNVEEHLRGSAVREPEFDDRLLDLYLAGLGGSAMR